MWWNRYGSLGILFAVSLGCAHQATQDKETSLNVENRMLKERVRRLEHRVRDLDAKVMFLAQNKDKNKVLKKRTPPRHGLRNSIDLDVSQEDLQIAFETLDAETTSQKKGPVRSRGGALGVTESFSNQKPISFTSIPKHKKARQTKLAHLPVAVSNETQGTVMETTGGFAYMAKAKPQYEWARKQLLSHQCERAIPAFRNLLTRFPKHELADNSLYWTAFCFAELGNTQEALHLWRELPMAFPRSAKRPDALFQRATLLEQDGKRQEATNLYIEILKHFPRAEKRAEASRALKRIKAASQ